MKSILLHIHDDLGAESRLQAACDIARACDAHIHCVQGTALPDLVAADMYGGAGFAPSIIAELREVDEKYRVQVEERLRREGVSWDWLHVEGDVVRGLLGAAKLVDLIVATLPQAAAPRQMNDPLPIAIDLALGGRTPVLAVPQAATSFPLMGRAIVAWDGSLEASAALTSAVPLLKFAREVVVVVVEEVEKQGFPSTEAPEYLARHGIVSQLHSVPRDGKPVADQLLGTIQALAGDWVVMGAFGHSRLRETVFGGVTRAMLRANRLPLLLAH